MLFEQAFTKIANHVAIRAGTPAAVSSKSAWPSYVVVGRDR